MPAEGPEPPREPGVVPVGDYYISPSGDDDADGTISSPWRTFARANASIFQPGSRILLESDAIYRGTLAPLGNGAFDSDTFESTFDETLVENTLACQQSTVFAEYHSLLVADGVTEPAASEIASDFCARLAREDAIRAGNTAADASSQWITIGSYGVGARPQIVAGPEANYGIKFPSTYEGGWKISDVDVDTTRVASIAVEPILDSSKVAGLWIENAKLTNSTGMPVRTDGNYPGSIKGYVGICASGVSTAHVNNVVMKNVEIADVDSPHFIFAGNGHWFENCYFHDSYVNGAFLQGYANRGDRSSFVVPISNWLMEATTITRMGVNGYAKGVANVVIANSRDFSLSACDISLSNLDPSDGIAIDFEGNTAPDAEGTVIPWIGFVHGSSLHDNDGAAFLHNQHLSQGSNPASRIFIYDNTFSMNGTTSFPGVPAILRQRTGLPNNNIVFTANTTIRGAKTQKLFAGNEQSTTAPVYDTPQDSWIFGASNIVTAP